MGVVTPLNNPGGPEGDTVTVAEKLLNTEYRQMKCLQKIQELQLRLQEMSTQCAEKEALRLEAHRAGTYLIYRFLLKNEISTVKLHLAFFEI